MARETIKKVLQCKIAFSNREFRTGEPSNLTLVQAVRTINDHFTQTAERRAVYGSKAIECRGYRDLDGVVGIYLVGYVPDDQVGIVPHNADELTLLPPPANADFLDGELMALIADEATIVCRLGLYESALNAYVESLGQPAGLNAEDASFLFKNRTDVDKLKMIADDGVAFIRFDGVASDAAVQHVVEDRAKPVVERIIGSVWRDLRALAHAEDQPDVSAEGLKVEVYLKFDKRSGTQIDQDAVTEIAETIANEVDGFVIETLSGRKITPTDVLLAKPVTLQKFGKSVAFNDVFAEMLAYYRELTEPGGAEDA